MAMGHRRITAVAVSLMLLAGCGGPPQPPVLPTLPVPEPTLSPGSLPSQAAVTAALLAPAEIPAGPFRATELTAGDAAGFNKSLTQCAEAIPNPDPEVVAVGTFQGPSALGPYIAETITVTSTASTTRLISELDRVQSNCAAFGGKMEGGIELEITITPLTMPPIADGTRAFRITVTVPNAGAAVYGHLVAVRAGNVFVQIALIQVTSPDVAVTRALTELAVTKAAALRAA